MEYENTIEFAKSADSNDILKNYRERFHFPKIGNNECLYFTGNSLGLQPKTTKEYINRELDDWAEFGVGSNIFVDVQFVSSEHKGGVDNPR